MFSRFTEFANLDLISCQDLDRLEGYSQLEKGPVADTIDAEMDCPTDQEPLFIKSFRNITEDYEISFENSFMKEHADAFKAALAKHMEFLGISQKKTEVGDWKQLILRHGHAHGLNNTSQVVADLQNEDKLAQFLDVVCESTPSALAADLTFMAVTLLREYEQVRTQDLTSQKLLELAQNCTEESGEKTYDGLVRVFSGTVLLVLEQFFENPFVESSSPKRTLNWSEDSEEEQFESAPQKKRKYSF